MKNEKRTYESQILIGYEGLMTAIGEQAAKDYIKLVKIKSNTQNEIDKIIHFFNHECESVIGVDGTIILKKIDEQLKKDGFIK